MPTNLTMRIVVDPREQTPWTFPAEYALGKYKIRTTTVRDTLQSGDYSMVGFEQQVALERKSLDDFIGSISTGRTRFERELHRLRGFDFAAVLVEGTLTDVRLGAYRSQVKPQAAIGSIAGLWNRFRVPFTFVGDQGGWLCWELLYHYLKQRYEEHLVARKLIEGDT